MILDWRCRASQIENLVDFHVERKRNVVPVEFEMRIVQQMNNVITRSSEKVVDAKYIVPVGKQPLAEMRSDKTRSAGY